nr:formyltetrahydrofolate deformylase [Novosphingopyxis iocasae]
MEPERWILTLMCRDRSGIVAAVSGALTEQGGFILDSQQYADLESGRFFMRICFQSAGEGGLSDLAGWRTHFAPLAVRFEMELELTRADDKPRVLVAVSKGSHCLSDLLYRQRSRSLAVEIAAVVSNHDDLREIADWHGVPFHHLPVSDANRIEQEAAIEALMDDYGASHLILARYMQVLTQGFADRMKGRCINIHHSFLPGFKGANPYAQAFERGVKLIGATAHFVTGDLDEGPIIAQAVEPVDHRDSERSMIRSGRDIEARVLAKAVNAVGERRLFLNGARTVVFE